MPRRASNSPALSSGSGRNAACTRKEGYGSNARSLYPEGRDAFGRGRDSAIYEVTEVVNNVEGLPKQLNGFVDVSSFLGKAGITPDQTAQIVDVLANSVKGKVPDDVVNTFVATLK